MNAEERDEMLKTIHDNVGEIKEWKAALDVRCAGHRRDTDIVTNAVFDEPHGLKYRQNETDKQVQKLSNCTTTSRKWKERLINVLTPVAVVVILAVIAWALNLWKTTS